MGIFGGGQQQQRLFGVRVNQSKYGDPYPVVMGTAQVQQSVLWVDGFSSVKLKSKGKGGKSGQYDYSADVVVALCNGKLLGIGDVWSGQSWLGNPLASELYTIASPYTYQPVNYAALYNDLGVGLQNAYSGSYPDVGAPANTALSGTDLASMTLVPYGTSLTTGLYSINPTGNVYHFSSADNGRVAQISYSFLLTTMNLEQRDIVPSGKQISVSGVGTGSTVVADYGVTYAAGANNGVALKKVNGTPSVTGTYSVSGNNPATYKFAPGDINALVIILYGIKDPQAVSPGQATSLNFTLNPGAKGQSPFAFLSASYPDAAFGYTGIACLLYQPMDLGMGAQIQENRFEVLTADAFGGGVLDCNPIQCIGRVLTDRMWGLGAGPVPFPTSVIDNGASGTWGGAAATPGARVVASTAWNWFAAHSFFISPVLDGQDSGASTISKWLEAGMCAGFMSEGLFKLVPYGDTSAAGNGVTWTAPSAYIVALDDTCFLEVKDDDPVKIGRGSTHDAWNVVQVSFDNRQNQYANETIQESDQGLIDRWGERRESAQSWPFIHTVAAATFAANMRVKHNQIRGTFEFGLPFTYAYLEPMAVITISTTSLWAAGLNNANLGVTNLPVRILKIVDDPEKGLAITAEEYPFGAHQPTLYNKQLGTGDVAANAYVDPGNTEAVMFEAYDRLTGYAGDEIWFGALGVSKNWGSCNIWVSRDGTKYASIGSIKTPAKLGALHSTFGKTLSGSPAAYDPDSADSLVVDLATNCEALTAFSTTDADNGVSACFVDGEIISYSAMTYTGQDQVTMDTYIRRGVAGTTIASHSAAGLFLVLDGAIFKYTYDPTWRGQTLYFKFQSVNVFGNMAQDLSTLTPTMFTLPGLNPGSVDAETGLVLPSANQSKMLGAWSSIVAYVAGNQVTSGGNVYSCILPNTNQIPPNATYWTLVANNAGIAAGASYRPLTNPLTAHDAGSNVTVTVAAFTMRVAGHADISVNGGSLTGLSYGTLLFCFYSDPTLAGGAVSYSDSTTKTDAMSSGVQFFVGSILTPKATAPDTIGNNDGGATAQTGSAVSNFALTEAHTGVGVHAGAGAAIDRDWTTEETYLQSIASNIAQTFTLSNFGNVPFYPLNVSLQIKAEAWGTLCSNAAAGETVTAAIDYSPDGGATWTNVRFNTATGPGSTGHIGLAVDTIALPNGTLPSSAQVRARIELAGASQGTNSDGGSLTGIYECVYRCAE